MWIADPEIDVVIATGGTGVTGRDVTPEAFHSVYEKEIAGFGELFRWLSYAKIGTSTIQSRATAGVAGGTYLFALPGSPGACRDAWDDILSTSSTTVPSLQFRRADAAPAGAFEQGLSPKWQSQFKHLVSNASERRCIRYFTQQNLQSDAQAQRNTRHCNVVAAGLCRLNGPGLMLAVCLSIIIRHQSLKNFQTGGNS